MKVKISKLSAQQKQLVIDRVAQELAKLEVFYQREFPQPKLGFDLSGAAAGQFSLRRGEYLIRFNAAIFSRYFQENLNSTVAHEVAHLAVQVLYPKRIDGRQRVLPHGRQWRALMALLEAEASVCHKYDLSGLPLRKERRFVYRCDCQEHQISCRRHNKIQATRAQYLCRQCGSGLRAIT